MGGHLPKGKRNIYPVVSTCPPSERCTIYPVPTIPKARYLRDCDRHPLVDAFIHGLTHEVRDELLAREVPDDLERLIALAIRVDARLEDRRRWRQSRSSPPRVRPDHPRPFRTAIRPRGETAHDPPPRSRCEPEPMVVDQTRVREGEPYQRLRTGACFRCSEKGHFVGTCPVKDHAH